MRVIRILALAVVGGLIAFGLAVDRGDRPAAELARAWPSALAVAKDPVTTWFCPGGSGPGGPAELTVEIVSRSSEPRTATVSVAPGGRVDVAGADFEVAVPPGGRTVLPPAEAVPGAQWVGAVVEVDGSDVVVEQTVAGLVGGVGRSPCSTRTAARWVIPYGGTRFEAEGERFVVMLLNPFPGDAVADVGFAADVGPDSLEGVVIPAGEVVAIDVTEEVTVASAVAVTVDVVAGRLSVSRLQSANGPTAGRGIRVSPGIPGAASVWHLPLTAAVAGRRDLVAVANPSDEIAAEIAIEILADDPAWAPDPIEITVRPGRTVVVDLSRMGRLAEMGPLSLIVRSSDGVPVAVSLDSVVLPDAPAPAGVAGTAAAAAADAAARRWMVPVESTAPDPASARVAIVNPSASGIATIDLAVGGEVIEQIELPPRRRALLPVAELKALLTPVGGVAASGEPERSAPDEPAPDEPATGGAASGEPASGGAVSGEAEGSAPGGPATELPPDRFVLEVVSSAPVVVARELVGLTSRTAALGVAVGEATPLSEIP